jgi:phosphoribosylaminoimidazolecarboxamide formyltransferase/IMP cyclohydrolase
MGKAALISVYDKAGLTSFAAGLHSLGFKLYASGGTAGAIMQAHIPVIPTETLTGVVSLLGGRVKTLHPELHAAILADGGDRREREEAGKVVFDLVAVDFYPFHKAMDLPADSREAIELVDVGGPTMARAAAKNWAHVISAVGTDCFQEVLENLKTGGNTSTFRRRMAARTFRLTCAYDQQVALKLEEGLVPELRYGENPHQKARIHFTEPERGFRKAEILGGKTMSFNNYSDASAACAIAADLPADKAGVVLLKHGNPCGAGTGASPVEAFENALRADRTSPYGGILVSNRAIDMELAARLKEIFLEIIIAPDYETDALNRLLRRKNLRTIRLKPERDTRPSVRSIWGGLLIQEQDASLEAPSAWKVVTKREPSALEIDALDIAWRVVKNVKSNAIVIGDHRGTLGVGIGQPSRVESLDLAVRRAIREGNDLAGSALASDAFFPFRDGPVAAAKAGVRAIIQPGGSIRDDEVTEACDHHGIAMVFTGMRHFLH